jgi:SAM-dependent methyltransferase
MKNFLISFKRIIKPDLFYFEDYLQGKILNYGCGFRKNKKHIGVDINNKSTADFIIKKDRPLPFKSNEFDIVISRFVFEHIEDLDSVLNEISRVLKKDGRLVFCVPHVWSIDAFDDPTHKSFYTLRTMNFYCSSNNTNVLYKKNYFKYVKHHLRVTLSWPRISIIRIPISLILSILSFLAPKFSEYLLKLPFLTGVIYFELSK